MRRALLAALAATALASSARALDVPYLSGRVNDEARLLDAAASRGLETALKSYEDRTGRQIVVLTLPSLEGEVLEDFALKTARTWKLGRKGKDDGILILVARDDHKARIEVGYGLEGVLPDVLAGRIIRDEMVPRFRSGDYAGGIASAVDAVIKSLDGTYSPPPDLLSGRGDGAADVGMPDKILMGLFVFGALGLFEFVGLFAPGAGWFMYFFLIPFWAAFPLAIVGAKIGLGVLCAHLVGFPIFKLLLEKTGWGKRMLGNVVFSSGHGYGGGLGGGGWSSGGGSSGFSGGGGSFGGGGSSGSW